MEKENKQKWVEEFDNLWGELEDSECRGFDSQPFKAFIQKTLDTQLEDVVEMIDGEMVAYCDHGEKEQEPCSCESKNQALQSLKDSIKKKK